MQDKINQKDAEGKRHGPWIEYYSNGQIYSSGEYIHGKPHGSWFQYFESGSLWYKETYDMNKRIGYFIYYHYHNGSVFKKQFYAR